MKSLRQRTDHVLMPGYVQGYLLYCKRGTVNQVLRWNKTSICLPPMFVNGYTDIMSKASQALKILDIVIDPVFNLKNKSKK